MKLRPAAAAIMTDVARTVVLIIPTLNEAASIGTVVRSVPRDVVGRIIVADGGSSDDTGECAQRSGAEVLDVGRGYGRACLLATQAATDADIVVFMDGDGADDVQAIQSLVDPIRPYVSAWDVLSPGSFRGAQGTTQMGPRELRGSLDACNDVSVDSTVLLQRARCRA
jgi:glycosyltransferase involved in cell wall biosynthesis